MFIYTLKKLHPGMAISIKFKNIITKANETNNPEEITAELDRLKGKNYNTYITTLYSVNKLVKDEWKDIFSKPTPDMIKEYSLRPNADNKKTDEYYSGNLIEYIIDDYRNAIAIYLEDNTRLKDVWEHIAIYQLLNTGRRVSEVLFNNYEIRNNKLWMEINKQKQKILQEILRILDNNIPNVDRDLKLIHEAVSTLLQRTTFTKIDRITNRRLGFSTHKLRAIYVRYCYIYRNPEKYSIGSLVKELTNHLSRGSDTAYSNVFLTDSKDYFKSTLVSTLVSTDLTKLTHQELNELLKNNDKLIGNKTRNKKEKIEILNKNISPGK